MQIMVECLRGNLLSRFSSRVSWKAGYLRYLEIAKVIGNGMKILVNQEITIHEFPC